MERQLRDLVPTRRELLKWGGAALAGAWVDRVVWPRQVRAQGRTRPRGSARNCIFIEMGGAISQMECWDFKETRFTPTDLEPQRINDEIVLSRTLFPNLGNHMDRVSFVRSMRANELVHFIGQYHTQTGRALNVALAREIPGFGSVIAYELESRRADTDTFPTYMGTYLTQARAGAISSGFLPTRFTCLDLNPTTVFESFGGNREGLDQLLEERWRLLRAFAEVSEAERASFGKKATDYRTYYDEAERLEGDPRWQAAFRTDDAEKLRYGDDEFGLGLILAKNVIAADAGTHFMYVYDGDRWDHHSFIFTHERFPRNHYFTCNRFDQGLTALLEDLGKMPGHDPSKTLLDETLIVATSEFGRTPEMNPVDGRDHWREVYTALFAGGGVQGGRVIGRSDEMAAYCLDSGWKHPEQPFMDNIVATIYSALGIDWRQRIVDTPSNRGYDYIQTAPIGGGEFIDDDEIAELFE